MLKFSLKEKYNNRKIQNFDKENKKLDQKFLKLIKKYESEHC